LTTSGSIGDFTLNNAQSFSTGAITTTAGRTINLSASGAGNTITTTGALAVGTGGNISLTADDVVIGANLSGTGTLTLQPTSLTRMVRVNNGAGDFNIDSTEISRLVNTDFTKLFQDLQKSFIDQTRKDLATELKKFDEKSTDLQTKIDELRRQVERLEKIDLEKHFDKLQKTLSEIFGAINAINITLTAITQTLNSIVQSLGAIQNAIDTNHKETKQVISSFSDATTKHLSSQDREAKRNTELLESKIKSLAEQNDLLKKEVKTNRIIQIVGLTIILIILIYVAVK
jgi:uncharacterized protein YukE